MRPIAKFTVQWWIFVGLATAISAVFAFVGPAKLDKWLGLGSPTEAKVFVSEEIVAASVSQWDSDAEEIYSEIKGRNTKAAEKRLGDFKTKYKSDPRTIAFIDWTELQIGIENSEFDKIQAFLETAATHPNADPMLVNNAAWTAWLAFEKDHSTNKEFIETALTASRLVLPQAKTESNPAYLLDTIAHLEFAVGDLQDAIATQKIAVLAARGSSDETSMREFLKQLQESLNTDTSSE